MSAGRIAATALLGAVLSSCATIGQSTSNPGFQRAFVGFEFCALKAVKQQSDSACGLACLESLLAYWDLEGTQETMSRADPPIARAGYSLAELKSLGQGRGLAAFSVTFDHQPLSLLHSQLEKGRPTLLAIRCPLGHYFGDPIPIIEHFDSTVISTSIREERFTDTEIVTTRDRKKDHYVVAFGYNKAERKMLLMDPAYGLVAIGESRLMNFWSDQNYSALVCARATPAPEAN